MIGIKHGTIFKFFLLDSEFVCEQYTYPFISTANGLCCSGVLLGFTHVRINLLCFTAFVEDEAY